MFKKPRQLTRLALLRQAAQHAGGTPNFARVGKPVGEIR